MTRFFHLGGGFDLHDMKIEFQGYVDVLLGRTPPPVNRGPMTLMECAEAYHARAREVEMNLLLAEMDGVVVRGSRAYRFRTGYLRSFIELCSKSIDLGSRRVTYEVAKSEGKV